MHILKQFDKDNNSKGIVIITHKEIARYNPIFDKIIKLLSELQHQYFIIYHNGFSIIPSDMTIIDLYMTTIPSSFNKKCIPFTSRNFLDKIFKNNIENIYERFNRMLETHHISFKKVERNNQKIFDFICVNRSVEFKKTLDLLKYSIEYIKNTNKNVCFVVIENNEKNPYYNEIIKYYEQNKLDNLLFINGLNIQKVKNSIWKGLTREELSTVYNLSKVYMHGCEEEGESRTIHEALCCGCMVLAKENMKGGGLDYLNNTN